MKCAGRFDQNNARPNTVDGLKRSVLLADLERLGALERRPEGVALRDGAPTFARCRTTLAAHYDALRNADRPRLDAILAYAEL